MINNRQQQQGRRRGRGRNPQSGGGRNENGSRIDNRARGNAPQMLEKYKNMARDAQMQGDRVMTEYYLQFADHYFRIVAEQRARYEEQRGQRDDWQGEDGEADARQQVESLDDEADGFADIEERPQRQPRQQQRDNPRRENREPREARAPRENETREPRRFNNRNGNVQRELEEEAPATLDISVLPPAFASDGPMVEIDLEDAPPVAPRKRGRPRRDAAAVEEAAE